ncbi:exo-beta-N-acetylmuramidase NamZ family protein [Aquimarina rhabdastrellae]
MTDKTALPHQDTRDLSTIQKPIITGANQVATYLPYLKNKKVAIVGNQTSVIFKKNTQQYTHLVDSLLSHHIAIQKVFAPEHGFRGKADAGEHIVDGKDQKTRLPIISLYGKNKKPSPAILQNVDLILFDIQDVGARFYTYISTLHYVMQAAAENHIEVMILDRPNPNGHYVDGPTLDLKHKSFVGMHPIPIVHGMTIGEYAQMINGQGWLGNDLQCKLKVIKMQNYSHNSSYSLPIKPSPNLPNDQSINLYPSLCFFEGTTVNAGRGTNKQFQVYGSPFLPVSKFSYTPKSNAGAKHPKHKGKRCYGEDLSTVKKLDQLNLNWLLKAYQTTQDKDKFFNSFFVKLAGTSELQQQIKQGLSEKEIRASWKKDLDTYKQMRTSYLLYP